MKSFNLMVGAAQVGLRLDVYLTQAGLELSRRRIRMVIDVGGVYVNDKRVRIASRLVGRGDRVRVEYSESGLKQLKTQSVYFGPQDLLLDQDQVFALNKPPGMPAQATRDQSIQHVVPCLEALLKERGETRRRKLVLVHRLDKETTGVILVADGDERATWLTDLFRKREVKKVYWAVCHGIAKEKTFTEKAFLSEIDRKTGDVRVVRSGGRSAVTHFRVLAENPKLGLSLLECRPETGRSHQIRVHLDVNDLPIVGDKRYGSGKRGPLPESLGELSAVHHLLHARELTFRPKDGAEPLTVRADLPERFAKFLPQAGLGQ